ncbi:hypothetical protein KAK07_23500 [Ideonella sp. 4Y16]|uniref:Uncharacterized protein n=1 Tax=Ideonella aquatica TaxID=2824119 RepID=A0A940YKS1_9BURK|nr:MULTISPECIES: hypothetical protein [Ideonella]MBQ0946325.1 hypothetical protein [Ideonella alba]MBQ0960467.1 hypothetical protein [Ideonella aquatica]
MKRKLNPEQRKHVAGVIDKAAIAYFAVVGYTAWSAGQYLVFAHAILAFVVFEALAVWILKEPEDEH